MKRALFISTRNPFSERYSGDIIGSKNVIKNLKKIYSLDIVSMVTVKIYQKKTFSFLNPPFFYLKYST